LYMPEETNTNSELSASQKREWAMQLYLRDDLTQKQIAATVGVSENTMSKWVIEGMWEGRRKTLLTTREEIIRDLYEGLSRLNKANKESLEDDDPETEPNYDAVSKMTRAIKNLERETGIGDMIHTARALIDFVRTEDTEAAKVINKWADLFIKDKIKSAKL